MNLDDIFGFKLYKNFSLLKGLIFEEFHHKKIDINFEQWVILNRLWDHDGLTQHALLELTMQKKGNLTRTLKKMEELSLLTKKNNKDDLRSFRIFLCPKAKNLKNKLRKIVLEKISLALKGIDKEDLKIANRVLDQMEKNIRSI
ncbi:MAG: MarR family transcriptional regulator [Epsilonproteobacteria bacterium]|nr:MAG: MarR family transcriptional regulator [Campylobacterota bacterium]RLA66755.1 MAG: MarR family transcriptional regulator [Campylobacterota bacterium]